MSDIFATLAAGTPRPSGTGTGETAVRLVDPSPEFSRLTTGESLRGTVVGKDGHGHLLVRTQLGVLQLAAHRNLPPGTEVVLQVRSIGPQVLLNLLPLDSAAGQAALNATQSAPAPAPAPPGAAALPATPPATPHDLVQRGQVIRAVLHAAPPVPLLAGLPSAAPGADLLVQVISLGVRMPAQPGQFPAAPAPGTSPSLPGQAPTTGPAAPASGTAPPNLPGRGAPGAAAGSTATGQVPTPGGPALSGQGQAPAPVQVQVPVQAPVQAPVQSPGGAAPAGVPPAATGASATSPGPASNAPLAPGGPAASGAAVPEAPGLRLAPQIPVTNSGHSLAAALQSVSAEAAARAAGSLPGPSGIALPGSGAGPAAAPQALRLTGLVTGATSSGQPILHTALGTLTLDVKAALPSGSSLALQIALPPAPEGGAPPIMTTGWPSLEALEETLFQGLPAQQMEAVARALPQAGPRLASGILFFLSALNQGNPLAWLAPAAAAAAEREGASEIFERLGREFVGLNRSIETAAGEWRFVNLPLWSDQGLRELRCFYRHQEQGGRGDGDGEKATRFVLELELQRHGELQLDGLVRARRFDLMLRSRRPLPALVRGDLMALFEEANAIAGYSGQLVFQASKDWLQLLSARTESARQEGVRI